MYMLSSAVQHVVNGWQIGLVLVGKVLALINLVVLRQTGLVPRRVNHLGM